MRHTSSYDPVPQHRCAGCPHLIVQHGKADGFTYSRPGCWWCPCRREVTVVRYTS